MTTENAESGGETEPSEIVRPNFSIKQRHDNLLDELADSRYASRSEALRAAIEALARSVEDDSRTETEQLFARVEELSAQIEAISEQLEDVQVVRSQGDESTQSPLQAAGSGTRSVTACGETVDSSGNTELKNKVYALIIEEGPLSIVDIADAISSNELEVQQALSQLVDREFIVSVGDENPREYRAVEVE